MAELHQELLKIMESTSWLRTNVLPPYDPKGENPRPPKPIDVGSFPDDCFEDFEPNHVSDSYCWVCHRYCKEQKCRYCPRMYHEICAERLTGFIVNTCPVCLKSSVDETLPATSFKKEQLKKVLQIAMEKVFKYFSMFRTWPEHEKNERLIKKIDLYGLVDKISAATYSKPVHLFSDAQWLVHNCCLVYGVKSNEAKEAKRFTEKLKCQLLEIEACAECYERENGGKKKTNPFVELCTNPHFVVATRMKGFPDWPAKCLKVIGDIAVVKYFGKHELSRVRVSNCFLMTEPSRVSVKRQRPGYQRSINEMKQYIANYEAKHGSFKYGEPETRFIPDEHRIICHTRGRNMGYESEHGTHSSGVASIDEFLGTKSEESEEENNDDGGDNAGYRQCLRFPSKYTDDEDFVYIGRLPVRGHFVRTPKALYVYK